MKNQTGAAGAASRTAPLGTLPEWNLADLYPATDAPAFKADLDRARTTSAAFQSA